MNARTSLLLCALLLPLMICAQETRFVAEGALSARTLDFEGETMGGLGSSLDYDSATNTYLALADRGAGDGSIDYRPRFHTLRIELGKPKKHQLIIEPLKTTLLKDSAGKLMSGLIPDISSPSPHLADGRACIDPEAIALAPDGTVYISDEYGPFLYQFTREGTLLRTLHPPENYLPHRLDNALDFTDDAVPAWGRVPNRGFEGMSLNPDGSRAFLILQSGLTQDGGKNARWSRILVLDLKTEKPIAEYAYPMMDADAVNTREKRKGDARLKQNDFSVSEMRALNDHQFLVLERDNLGADGSKHFSAPSQKCVFVIDIADATDLLALEDQPYSQAPGAPHFHSLVPQRKIKPVQKRLLVNFAVPSEGYTAANLGAKWEGIALTPPDAQGHQSMVLASDNDFLTPNLSMNGASLPFPRAQRPQPTRFLLFDLKLQ